MSDYTPTVEQASRAYVTGMRQAFIASAGEHAEEFARFLADRDASVRAAALDEAAEDIEGRFLPGGDYLKAGDDAAVRQWLRDRASAIRALKEEKK